MGVRIVATPDATGVRASGFLGDFPSVAGDLSGSVNSGQVALSTVQPASAPSAHEPAAATPAVITYAAAPGQRHRLTALAWSYSAAPTGGRITVADGGTNVLVLDVTGAGPGSVPLPPGGIVGTTNTAMTITLASGAGAVVGKVHASKLTG